MIFSFSYLNEIIENIEFFIYFHASCIIIMSRVVHNSRSSRKKMLNDTFLKKRCLNRMKIDESLHQINKRTNMHRDILRSWRNKRHVYTNRRINKNKIDRFKKVTNVEIRNALRWTLNQKYKKQRLNHMIIIKQKDWKSFLIF
jgi:hypothetical protein